MMHVRSLSGLACLAGVSLLLAAPSVEDCSVIYSADDFREHHPSLGREFDIEKYELEKPVVVWDKHHRRKATVRRTRGEKYPYEDQKCVVTVEGQDLPEQRLVSVSGFRTVDVSWVTGKLLLMEIGLGRIAGVEAIYDVEKDLWVYRESARYFKKIVEPDSPAEEIQPPRPK